MNFIFISPNFPDSYWLFCQGLKNNGVNVLAIADTPYSSLNRNLKNAIHDYYQVGSLQSYDEVMRAVAFYIHKHGRIDWIESNNEYWLSLDARLRKDFNIANGITIERIEEYQSKYKMKEFYQKANIPTAAFEMASDVEHALSFAQRVGYPIIIKPNVGVGATDTHKLHTPEEIKGYFKRPMKEAMLMEQFIKGSCFSFDGITNSKKEILFVTSHQYTDSIMDAVNEHKSIGCYSYQDIPQDVMEMGTKAVQAFPTESRFFHFEFFRLLEDQPAVGKKGDILGLEVNMRPPGGFLPDMINYANDSNVYQLWADMIVHDAIQYKQVRKYSSCFIGRRDAIAYAHSTEAIKTKYGNSILFIQRLPQALASAMGEEVIVARFPTEKEVLSFLAYAQEPAICRVRVKNAKDSQS